MPAFRFDDTKTFDDNWTAFVAEAQAIDTGMAAILVANKDRLAAIVRQGNAANSTARAGFNAEVAKALDALLEKPVESKGDS